MSDTPETDKALLCVNRKSPFTNVLELSRNLERETHEQARLLGMSAERECDIRGELERERALADRLANALTNPAVYVAIEALAAWKEARGE